MRSPEVVVRSNPSTVALASLMAGQLAGLLWLLTMMIVYPVFLGRPALNPLQIIASALMHEGALVRLSPTVVAVGLLVNQFGPALFWSLVFGLGVMSMNARLRLNQCLLLGFLVGGVAVIVDVYLLMPPLQQATNGVNLWAMNVPPFWDWLAHLVYGLGLGFFYYRLHNRLAQRWAGRPPVPAP